MSQTYAPTSQHPSIDRYLRQSPGLAGKELLGDLKGCLIRGDAVETLATLPNDCVDLVHTSPPYNIDKPYESSSSDKSSIHDYVSFLQSAIGELKRVVRPGGSIFWQTGYTQDEGASREIIPIDLLSYEIFRAAPFPFLLWDRIIWRYWGGHAFTKKFTNKHETIMWYVKPGADPTFHVDAVRERAKEYDKRNNFWGRNPGNVWDVDRVAFGATEQTSHIAVFPEEVTERIVRACSEPSDLVLDPFAGSGTTPKVAHGLGRRWLGIEISPVYAGEAAIRIGFQQPSESDSLASELIKHIGFGGRKGEMDCNEITSRLRTWAGQLSISSMRAAFEDEVASVFADGNGRNLVKRDVWSKYDTLLSASVESQNPVVLTDRLLLNCYKLRQHFNGVTRYKSALSTLEEVAKQVLGDRPFDYIKRVVTQEPSSFEVIGDRLVLCSAQRAVGVRNGNAEPLNGAREETSPYSSQGKMPL